MDCNRFSTDYRTPLPLRSQPCLLFIYTLVIYQGMASLSMILSVIVAGIMLRGNFSSFESDNVDCISEASSSFLPNINVVMWKCNCHWFRNHWLVSKAISKCGGGSQSSLEIFYARKHYRSPGRNWRATSVQIHRGAHMLSKSYIQATQLIH